MLPLGVKSQKKIVLTNTETDEEISEIDTANYINEFFTNIGPNLAANFNTPWFYDGAVNQDNNIDTITATPEEVLKFCKKIDVNKSSCIEDISSRVMKDALIHLHVKFAHLINKSLTSGLFPKSWKYAKVTPLFKGGLRHNVGNYRPVSLLPLPSKIIEKIVHIRLMAFFENNNILDQNQRGFRKGHSTINTIAKLTDDIFNGMNKKELRIDNGGLAVISLRLTFWSIAS